jgi:hypothetical protein
VPVPVPASADRRKYEVVARRGVPAPGNHEPGLNGAWESQNVSVAMSESAELSGT